MKVEIFCLKAADQNRISSPFWLTNDHIPANIAVTYLRQIAAEPSCPNHLFVFKRSNISISDSNTRFKLGTLSMIHKSLKFFYSQDELWDGSKLIIYLSRLAHLPSDKKWALESYIDQMMYCPEHLAEWDGYAYTNNIIGILQSGLRFFGYPRTDEERCSEDMGVIVSQTHTSTFLAEQQPLLTDDTLKSEPPNYESISNEPPPPGKLSDDHKMSSCLIC